MNARKVVRQSLIRKKMLHWKVIACRASGDNGTARRARKNFWRLCARYPEIMMSFGWDEGSVY